MLVTQRGECPGGVVAAVCLVRRWARTREGHERRLPAKYYLLQWVGSVRAETIVFAICLSCPVYRFRLQIKLPGDRGKLGSPMLSSHAFSPWGSHD